MFQPQSSVPGLVGPTATQAARLSHFLPMFAAPMQAPRDPQFAAWYAAPAQEPRLWQLLEGIGVAIFVAGGFAPAWFVDCFLTGALGWRAGAAERAGAALTTGAAERDGAGGFTPAFW